MNFIFAMGLEATLVFHEFTTRPAEEARLDLSSNALALLVTTPRS